MWKVVVENYSCVGIVLAGVATSYAHQIVCLNIRHSNRCFSHHFPSFSKNQFTFWWWLQWLPPPFLEKSAGNTMLNALATATRWHTSLTADGCHMVPGCLQLQLRSVRACRAWRPGWEWGHNHHMNGDKPPAIAAVLRGSFFLGGTRVMQLWPQLWPRTKSQLIHRWLWSNIGASHPIRQDQWFRALAVMDTKAFQPDLVTFTSIASSCAKALQWQSDVALLSSLQNSATEIDAWISQQPMVAINEAIGF